MVATRHRARTASTPAEGNSANTCGLPEVAPLRTSQKTGRAASGGRHFKHHVPRITTPLYITHIKYLVRSVFSIILHAYIFSTSCVSVATTVPAALSPCAHATSISTSISTSNAIFDITTAHILEYTHK